MSLLVFASPYTPPPPPVSPVAGLAMTWTGVDGHTWNLNDPDGGVCLLLDAVEGLHLPEFADYVQEFDGIDGQEYSGGARGHGRSNGRYSCSPTRHPLTGWRSSKRGGGRSNPAVPSVCGPLLDHRVNPAI
jgi:hypothetical protein